MIKRAIHMNFSTKYPEGIRVYNLDEVSEAFAWSRLKVANYPDSKYIPNPALDEAEKILAEESLESLNRKIVYITGRAGTGKSTAAVQIMKLYQNKHQGKTLPHKIIRRPKLVLMTETVIGSSEIKFPVFSEPILALIDDYQFLKKDHQIAARQLIDQFARGEREGLVICISREHPSHISPYTISPIHVNCDVQSTDDYLKFIVALIKQEAKQDNVEINPDVEIALAKKILKSCEPPLYLVFLLAEHKDSQLTFTDLKGLPEGMKILCKRSWSNLTPSQKDLVRTILLLKCIQSPLLNQNVSIIYNCFFGRKDYSNVLPTMEGSIWFSPTKYLLIAPDSPYEVVDYEDIYKHLRNLGDILLGNHYDTNKIACIRQIHNFHLLLAQIGVFLRKMPDFAAACFKEVIEISLSKKQKRIALMARFSYGQALMDLERNKEAADEFSLVVKAEPKYVGAWSNLGVAFGTSEQYQESEKALSRALELDPNSVAALTNLGALYRTMNRHQEAEDAYKRALEIDPENTLTLYNLGIFLMELEKFEEGCNTLRKARENAHRYEGQLNRVENAIRKYCSKEETDHKPPATE